MRDSLGSSCIAPEAIPLATGVSVPREPAEGGGFLLGHLLRFGHLLRLMGVEVSTSQVLDLVEALQHVPISNRFDFYHASRALMVTRREDFLVFDQAFHLFWRREEGGLVGPPPEDAEFKRLRLPSQPGPGKAPVEKDGGGKGGDDPDHPDDRDDDRRDPSMSYSALEILRQKDFAEMSWEEIQAARQAMAELDWKLGQRRTRRLRPGPKGRLNMRRMIRDNLRHGGEPIHLAYRRRVYRPRSLAVLCDVSGSMERYSRMLLHFIHSLSHGLAETEVEAFVFGTRLTRVTRHLHHKDIDESLDELGDVVRDWSGGTRIGEAIKEFNYRWVRRVLGRGAVVLIISDGWDRGDLDLLTREMARLQRSAYRLIWLNPLLGSAEYKPVQRGLVVATPYVDDFLAVHNLASLEQLAAVLSSVGALRPVRKQHPRSAETQDAQQPEPPKEAPRTWTVADGSPYIKSHTGHRGLG